MLSLALHAALLFINASEKPNLAIVDLVGDALEIQERQEILKSLRKEFQWQSVYEVLREEDIQRLLVKTDVRQEAYQRELQKHQSNFVDIQAQIRQARLYYSESRFQEALSLLESAWYVLASSSFAADSEAIQSLLSYRAASEYFSGNVPAARETLRLLHFAFPGFNLSPSQFPPSLLQLQNEIRQAGLKTNEISIQANVPGFSVKFLGRTIADSGSADRVKFDWPQDLDLLKEQKLIVEKQGFEPKMLSVSQLSASVRIDLFEYDQNTIQTDQIFGVLGSLSPSDELLDFMKTRSIHVVLLVNASIDFKKNWILRGQLFRASNRNRTPVVESSGPNLDEVSERLARRLFMYVSPEGQILESQDINFLDRAQAPKPLYKKWWFWTAVGVGLAGVGTGSYFLFKPEDQVRFQVKQGGSD